VRGAAVEETLPVVAEILADVRARGDIALRHWTERFDGVPAAELRVAPDRIAAAVVDEDQLDALRALARAVEAFCKPQWPPDVSVEAVPGVLAERRWAPLAAVGIYVPGGRAPLPSSLVMTAVPARLAGVDRIAVATPHAVDAILVAARELGIDEVYEVGGAQAVAAFAYGTESIPGVDKIFGPGNRFVTAAKLLVSTRVAIDLPAGPSEIVVIADRWADPATCAADLLAQAEHGPDSEAILLTPDRALSDAVATLVVDYDNVRVELVESLDEALSRCERYAPEHLELLVADPEPLLARVRNAGTVFVGVSAVVGDYAAGASHVLPTGGLARAAGGLGLEAFLKPLQVVRADDRGLDAARAIVAPLARLEGLPLHAAALELPHAVVR
jgi:histidinol dehydrogenase